MSLSRTVTRRLFLGGLAVTGTAVALTVASPSFAESFRPGLLHTDADFTRIRAKLAAEDPVVTAGWLRLTANGRSHATWLPRPLATVIRGGPGQNYAQFFIDVHAAYQNALRWRISGDEAHAKAAAGILNAWSGTLTQVTGNADRFLAAGIYGYQFAVAADLLRDYPGFDLAAARRLLTGVFYPLNDQFLVGHNDACITNYWANWDLCTLASMMAIGILCGDRALFDRAVDYLKNGDGNGAIPKAVPILHGDLGQWQEAGRDQGHAVMGVGLLGTICEMAWNQGVDLYGYDDNRFLKGAEYVARYNAGNDVPFAEYHWGTGQNCAPRTHTVVSDAGRGHVRPVWESIYNHYVNRRGLSAPNVTVMAASVRAEGGGGDYGSASGGFDQLGFGTLMFTRDRAAETAAAQSAPPAGVVTSAGSSSASVVRRSRGTRTPAAAPIRPSTAVSSPATPPRGLDLARQQSSTDDPAGVLAGVAGVGTAAAALGGALLLRLRTRHRGDHREPTAPGGSNRKPDPSA
ncbi:alginate lyase family protein [Actinoplanes sp. NPDC026670]|uniref:alginate lyase family protein n=1 Tax=Actinoplanes sp. NPDC026670 TaxID=3154700 RepID=UPI0033C47A28